MADAGPAVFGFDRAVLAVAAVRDRFRRSTAVLSRAGVPYAVVGGNAVAAWVAKADEAAVRNTPNVDILLHRADLGVAAAALTGAGFVQRHTAGWDVFLDGPAGKARDAVRVVFAGEKVRPGYARPAPNLSDAEPGGEFPVIGLDALVLMKLTSHRTIDRAHLRDLMDVGLVDAGWPARFPPDLAARLQQLLDDPDG